MNDGRIVVSGPLTFQSVPPLVSQAGVWLQQNDREFNVDLSGVSRADSAGVALLLEWWNTLHAAQRHLTYVGVPSQVETFIRINGLDSILLK
jgi:phospholipid transport system transporter-binding protein